MDLRAAVAKTIAYSAYFNFPLSPEEIYFWLITPHPVSKSQIKKYLPDLKTKEKILRQSLFKNTRQKEKATQQFVKMARFLPGIKLIALTGSVAINNSQKDDDLDLLIVTSAHTLWLIRPLVLLLLSFKFNRRHPGDDPTKTGNLFCPNLWLDTLSLTVPEKRQNIYTAHEVLQIKPLFDRGHTYQAFLNSNAWVSHFLANAYQILVSGKIKKEKTSLLNYFFAPTNFLLFLLQYLYMLPKITVEAVSYHSAYFHKNDLSATLINHIKYNSL